VARHLALCLLAACGSGAGEGGQLLVYTRTAGYRHADSIAAGGAALAERFRGRVTITEELGSLDGFAGVIFLYTTGDVLDPTQQVLFEGFVRGGGGFIGIHSATDTEYDWPFYGALVGAYFEGHPDIQNATIQIEDPGHPALASVPRPWTRRDEWYNFRRNPRGSVNVLATLDERTYTGGTMASDHPIVWSHTYEGGRSFYTALGHTQESFAETTFVDHLGRAILWAGGAI